jgi:hypothetical protein
MMPVWGRKAVIVMGSVILGCIWGVYCLHRGADLTEAGVFWAAINTPTLAYMGANVYQKSIQGKPNGQVGGGVGGE